MYKLLSLSTLLILSGCAKTTNSQDASDAIFSDGSSVICTDPDSDWDIDGISNGIEGCLTGKDSNKDGTPDWKDTDSDSDGIPDQIEAGEKDSNGKCKSTIAPNNGWPCDSDNDGLPDYIDVDSDDDSILDKNEDTSGDGLLGCCLSKCNELDVMWQKDNCEVSLTEDGCGQGQECENQECTPAITFKCSNGETSPILKDTFGDGRLDSERGTFICKDATEDNPQGRKNVKIYKSETGDWHVALELTSKHAELTLANASAKQAAAVIDEDDTQTEVAGFVISRNTQAADVQTELTSILNSFHDNTPGGVGTVTIRASGVQRTTHDKFDGVHNTILDIFLDSASDVSTVRNEVIATLLNKSPAELGNLPSPYGVSNPEFVLRMVTVRRFDQENPTDQSKWRLVVMGSVASKDNYQDPTRPTGFIVDDLSNGTTLATASDSVTDECDVDIISGLPVADIIWVIDNSGSMDDNREDIVNNANNFFSLALAAKLDFRMGVTGVCSPNGSCSDMVGRLCSRIGNDIGDDRFLLPSEQNMFSDCVRYPPWYDYDGTEYGLVNAKQAVLTHLPRASNAPDKIRTEAQLVIIVATDEIPNSLAMLIESNNYHTCVLPAKNQTAVNAALQDYLNLFTGATDPEGAAIFHVIGGVCNNACGAEISHGYKELANALQGQIGDVCQQNLGNTLQIIIDSIIGSASPVKLEYIPISTSLAIALKGTQIERSRTLGFDYKASSNSIVFMNIQFDAGNEVVASYKRWKKQTHIE